MTSAAGRTYRILISRPAGEAPEGGYPILYILDGNAMFAGFAEARRIQGFGDRDLDKMIVVGIGHPGEQVYDPRRMEDFTGRSEEHTSELQSLMRISYAVFCLKKKKQPICISLHITTHNNSSET